MARLHFGLTRMSIVPLIPILILLGGALGAAASRLVRLKYPDAIGAVASLAALLALSSLINLPPGETLISNWQPLSVFGTPISLRVERLDWFIGLVTVLICAAISFAGLAYPGRRRFDIAAAGMGMTATVIAAAFASNLLTLVLAWGVFDVVYIIAALTQGREQDSVRRAAFIVGLNGAATLCVGIAALALSQANESRYWHLTHLTETAQMWLMAAAVLRLGLYPINQWLVFDRNDTPGRAAVLYVLPSLLGLQLLIRLATLNALPQASPLSWLAAFSLGAGGIMAWWRGRSRDALPYLALSGLGAVVLAGALSDSQAAVLISGAASWALAITTLSIGRGFDRRAPWWSIGNVLAIATLIGLPATLGFAVRTYLSAGGVARADWLLIALALLGETLMFAALARSVLSPADDEAPAGWPAKVAGVIGMALAALPPFVLPAIARGIVPEITPPAFEIVLAKLGAPGGLLIGLPIVFAAILAGRARETKSAPIIDPSRVAGLDWLYALMYWLIDLAARMLRGAASLLEGEGALLWALLIVIAAYVVWSGAIP